MAATLGTILPLLLSLAPIVFVIWFLIKIIKLQEERILYLNLFQISLINKTKRRGNPSFFYATTVGIKQLLLPQNCFFY
ncbi:hypothetical protein [Robertmurraya korlensis]|uniref:hypothetical protein n=1 Tax=Robertmurraya korlensis TaxID=519977 RepID=UPI0008263753|nr:hypothetical protein [Robertmurraya korlensis]